MSAIQNGLRKYGQNKYAYIHENGFICIYENGFVHEGSVPRSLRRKLNSISYKPNIVKFTGKSWIISDGTN